jgi:hypothetical protein
MATTNIALTEVTDARKGLVKASRGKLVYTKGAFKGDFCGWEETRYFVNTVAEVSAVLVCWEVEAY